MKLPHWGVLVVSGCALAALTWLVLLIAAKPNPTADAHAYWNAAQPGADVYARQWSVQVDAYVYSPAFLQLITPVASNLDYPTFQLLWTILQVAALAVAVGPIWAAGLVVPGIAIGGWPVTEEAFWGNIELLIVLAVAIGFRYPATWAFLLLTKITPGIGLVWFAARREWRALGIALGVTLAVAAASFLLSPGLWSAWIGLLTRGSSYHQPFETPLWLRVGLAALLVYCGARTDRRWTIPIAVAAAHPAIWLQTLAIPVALVPYFLLADRGALRLWSRRATGN